MIKTIQLIMGSATKGRQPLAKDPRTSLDTKSKPLVPHFLFGHSSGGCLALRTAPNLGSKVTRVAVYEAPWNDDPAARERWGKYIHDLTEALKAGRWGDAVALFMAYIGMPAEQIQGMRQAPSRAEWRPLLRHLPMNTRRSWAWTGRFQQTCWRE